MRKQVLIVGLTLLVVVGIGLGMRMLPAVVSWFDGDEPPQPGWTGPVRAASGPLQVMNAEDEDAIQVSWEERGRDAASAWVDVTALRFLTRDQPQWTLEVAARPPTAAALSADGTLVAYGLVFDTTADGVADYVVGINNDAPQAGHFRVWVTDLATGDTEEQLGPPYGFPVEFSHPDENPPLGMLFTFLPGSEPPGLEPLSVRFYAWASVIADGEVIAWDYFPDTAWLIAPPSLLDD